MDFSIHRIESGQARGPGPSKRRKGEREQTEFDVELGDEHPEPHENPGEHSCDTPVSAPDADEAGGRLDVTA